MLSKKLLATLGGLTLAFSAGAMTMDDPVTGVWHATTGVVAGVGDAAVHTWHGVVHGTTAAFHGTTHAVKHGTDTMMKHTDKMVRH